MKPEASGGVAIPFAVGTLGIALFSGMDAVMKGLTLAIGAYNAVFWRMLLGLAISGVPYLLLKAQWPAREVLRIHLIRGVVSSVMAITFFWGLARLPLAEAVALTFVAPLIALYLAAMVLREEVGRQSVGASLLGFAGVLVIVVTRSNGEGSERDLWGAASILCSALLYAYNIILMRQQALVAKPLEIAFFQYLVVALCLAIAAPFLAVFPDARYWPAIAFAALLALVSLMLLAWAYRRAEAQRLAPVEYTALVWAALFGWVIFSEPVSASTVIGAALIVTACIVAARNAPPRPPAVEPAI